MDARSARYFPSAQAFRAWLTEHHERERELWVGYYKVATGKPSMTWDESVDEALCFGWIDGVRRRVDAERYAIRFTPRRPGSNWSAKNVASVERLHREGRMRPAGLAAFAAEGKGRKPAGYSFEGEDEPELEEALSRRFAADEAAWAFFRQQPPGYRRVVIHWVASAKRPSTRERRLERVIQVSRRGERVDLVRPFG